MRFKASKGGPPPQEEPSVSFSELVAAHHRWADELHGPGVVRREVEEEYHQKLNAFERKHGEISAAYWCQTAASAVAMTVREKGVLGRHRDAEIRLYRVSDWVTANVPRIADLLHDCDKLAIKVSTVLEGTPERVAMQWILAVQSHLLGFNERSSKGGKLDEQELKDLVQRETAELIQIEEYYDRTGQKMARQIYVFGMLMGVILLYAVAVVVVLLLSTSDMLDLEWKTSDRTRTFFACYAAGALGAVVSVLSRMTRKGGSFVVDHEIGKRGLRILGSYRPLIGAITGLAVYFLARAELIQIGQVTKTIDLFVVLAFLAGFSERWAQVLLTGAETTISGPLGKPAGKPDAAGEQPRA